MRVGVASLTWLLCSGAATFGQAIASRPAGGDAGRDSSEVSRFASASDRRDWEHARAVAASASGYRVVVSLLDRRLWAIIGTDTLMDVAIAVASGASFEYQGRRWIFRTPRGVRKVLAKDSLPVWVPPEWHYYEVARERGLVVRALGPSEGVMLSDGQWLEVRATDVGIVGADSVFRPLPVGDEIIADGTVFIPPLGSAQRQVAGELGRYRIDLGGGVLLHGTPEAGSIGTAATHGCIRLRDPDIAWLFEFVPLGTRVYIY